MVLINLVPRAPYFFKLLMSGADLIFRRKRDYWKLFSIVTIDIYCNYWTFIGNYWTSIVTIGHLLETILYWNYWTFIGNFSLLELLDIYWKLFSIGTIIHLLETILYWNYWTFIGNYSLLELLDIYWKLFSM